MTELKVQYFLSLAVFLLCVSVLFQPCYGQEGRQKDRDAFLRAESRSDAQQRSVALNAFVKRFPESEFCDDALLRVLKDQLESESLAAARKTLKLLKERYPEGAMRRHLYLGDPEDAIVEDWKAFVSKNPILSTDWGEWLIAEYQAGKGEAQEAKGTARTMLARTKKVSLPEDADVLALSTEDLRGNLLKLSFRLARDTGDEELLSSIRNIAIIEYGARDEDMTRDTRLFDVKVLKKKLKGDKGKGN